MSARKEAVHNFEIRMKSWERDSRAVVDESDLAVGREVERESRRLYPHLARRALDMALVLYRIAEVVQRTDWAF